MNKVLTGFGERYISFVRYAAKPNMANSRVFKLIMFSFLGLGACNSKSYNNDDSLSIAKANYNGVELRINGYYFSLNNNVNDTFYTVIFFYRNGEIIHVGSFPNSSLLLIEEYLSTERFKSQLLSNKDMHGLYSINSTILEFEKWYPDGGGSYKTSICNIINDSTFIILRTGTTEKNETYNFKSFSQKPDSTNSFIP